MKKRVYIYYFFKRRQSQNLIFMQAIRTWKVLCWARGKDRMGYLSKDACVQFQCVLYVHQSRTNDRQIIIFVDWPSA